MLTCNRLFLIVRSRSSSKRKNIFPHYFLHIISFISTTVKIQPIFTFSAFLIIWRYCGWIPFVFSQYPKDWQFFCIPTGDSCIHALSCTDYCKPFPQPPFLFSSIPYDSPVRFTRLLQNPFVPLFKSLCVSPLDYLIMLFPIFHILSCYPKGPLQFTSLLFLSCWCCSCFCFACHTSHLPLLSKS